MPLMTNSESFTVVGVGELLWDLFPSGRRLGGAPVNFASHCRQLGAEAYPVSAVGEDALGRDIRDALLKMEVSDRYVMTDQVHPTGTVEVTLDEGGKPAYEICEGVAWDFIRQSEELVGLFERADAVCFGSLAQRNGASRKAIQSLLSHTPDDALKMFDVNLRQAFYSKAVIADSLLLASCLKLSDEELPVMAEMFDLKGNTVSQLRDLIERFELSLVAYTKGPEGSLLVTTTETDEKPEYPAVVVNSVGAGDAFTAALCLGLLRGHALSDVNAHANRVAAYVCSQDRAVPVLPRRVAENTPE